MTTELEPFDRAAAVEELRDINEALAKLQALSASVDGLVAAAHKYKTQRDRLLHYAKHKMHCALLDYHNPVDRGCTCDLEQLLEEMRA